MVHKEFGKLMDAVGRIQEDKFLLDFEGEQIKEIERISAEESMGKNQNFVPIKKEDKKKYLSYIINENGEEIAKPSSNKKCHCGSGIKYKVCCMDEDNKRMEIIAASRSTPSKTSDSEKKGNVLLL